MVPGEASHMCFGPCQTTFNTKIEYYRHRVHSTCYEYLDESLRLQYFDELEMEENATQKFDLPTELPRPQDWESYSSLTGVSNLSAANSLVAGQDLSFPYIPGDPLGSSDSPFRSETQIDSYPATTLAPISRWDVCAGTAPYNTAMSYASSSNSSASGHNFSGTSSASYSSCSSVSSGRSDSGIESSPKRTERESHATNHSIAGPNLPLSGNPAPVHSLAPETSSRRTGRYSHRGHQQHYASAGIRNEIPNRPKKPESLPGQGSVNANSHSQKAHDPVHSHPSGQHYKMGTQGYGSSAHAQTKSDIPHKTHHGSQSVSGPSSNYSGRSSSSRNPGCLLGSKDMGYETGAPELANVGCPKVTSKLTASYRGAHNEGISKLPPSPFDCFKSDAAKDLVLTRPGRDFYAERDGRKRLLNVTPARAPEERILKSTCLIAGCYSTKDGQVVGTNWESSLRLSDGRRGRLYPIGPKLLLLENLHYTALHKCAELQGLYTTYFPEDRVRGEIITTREQRLRDGEWLKDKSIPPVLSWLKSQAKENGEKVRDDESVIFEMAAEKDLKRGGIHDLVLQGAHAAFIRNKDREPDPRYRDIPDYMSGCHS
ncbi:hypothetical protein BJ508DRAFT_182701 [Ascobolus immersus RN42]|uniref:Uncharacterized protein n=1 Tax=Ascobolus immersus RN42 TaxID=1160509 RepID=A0A3N4HXI0_ASCIM|nr:hypothetical protein BJ508DRAFT_182701 [Ascobolus immersus RN42]